MQQINIYNSYKYLLVLLLLIIPIKIYPQTDPVVQGDTGKKIHEYMTKLEQAGYSGGLLVAQNGDIVYSGGMGFANRAEKLPFTSQTVFLIGSITKQFTAAAILKLEMMDKLSVNDKLTHFFDDVPADKENITLHHLLTHSAGFPGALGFDYDTVTRREYIKLAMNTKLPRKPGISYEYSNVGYSLLAAVIEIVSGKSYDQFLKANIFDPAAMHGTGYTRNWPEKAVAHGYKNSEHWGDPTKKNRDEDGPYWHLRGNGGLLSNLQDLYRWHRLLLGDRLLSKSAKKKYFTPHIKEGPDADTYYGYGWVIGESGRGTKIIFHDGGNPYFNSDFRRFIDEQAVIIMTSNNGAFKSYKHSREIEKILFGQEYSLPGEGITALPPDEFFKTPQGQRAKKLFALYKSYTEDDATKFLQEQFSKRLLDRYGIDELKNGLRQDHQEIGAADIHKVIQKKENIFAFTLQSGNSGDRLEFTLHFEKESPFKIAGILVSDAEPVSRPKIPASWDSFNEKWGLPGSPTGRMCSAFLEVVSRNDEKFTIKFIEELFAREFRTSFKMEQHLEIFRDLHQQLGRPDIISLERTGENSAAMILKSQTSPEKVSVQLTLTNSSPLKIDGLQLDSIE